jgi:adenylate cyclase
MPRNVEITARLANIDRQIQLARQICNAEPTLIEQQDIFFSCDHGRLKLRIFAEDDPNNAPGELIYYTRPDQEGPKTSNYVIAPTNHPQKLRSALSSAYGERGVVTKSRLLFLAGRTRIHLDEVEDLGQFLELEVVLGDDEDESVGESEARALMAKLEVDESSLIQSAYVDLLHAD